MLDSETKRRIDSARDILVGKVPDPKSQVEQITIALIYKFMDDMDAEAEELGGKRSFFVGEYEKFSWAKLLSPALSGYDMLNLYGESIDKMTRNQGVPQLFRDIFKNAYLPYRDPETLKMFLKVINDFNYDHSEKLGDAFEYLLSVLGSQGDAGQFRTPRHIIDFMVKVLDPQKDESILDPACGTAGFLISAYKHVMASNATPSAFGTSPKEGKFGGGLTPAERRKLADNIRGYDISPDMVRLSLVNLYLHGFTTPNIFEYDTLASEERWNDTADVILANPPFMSPKGGIMPHKKFSVQSNRSEVLFVDYMAEHLTSNGRAAIIVPEGIIFQSAGAYKQLRKYLIEHNFLWAVVSLPAGAFNPYSGVKTSILFLDKSLAKKTDKVLFVKVENDGFDLGAQRRPIDRNDLPETLKVLKSFRASILDGKTASFAPTIDSVTDVVASGAKQSPDNKKVASSLETAPRNDMALVVPISKLTETGDYNLSADRYRDVIRVGKQTHPMVALGDVAELIRGVTFSKKDQLDYETPDSLRVATTKAAQENGIIEEDLYYIPRSIVKSEEKLLQEGDILISTANSLHLLGRTTYVPKLDYKASFGAFMTLIRAKAEIINPIYLLHCLRTDSAKTYYLSSANTTTNISNLTFADLNLFQIPLPPLEIQRQLVDEIAAHQRIIDGARQVIEEWKPDIELELNESLPDGMNEWEAVKLGDICETSSGGTPLRSKKEFYENGTIPWLKSGEVAQGFVMDTEEKITELGLKNSSAKIFPVNTVLVALYGATAGQVGLLKIEATTNQAVCGIFPNKKFIPEYLYLFLKSKTDYLVSISSGGAQPNISQAIVRQLEIPLPPLEIQREIVTRIETERAIVHGNRELIRLYEEKVKKVIERVWES